MSFISDLERLKEKATKRPVAAGRKTEYGTIWPDSIMTASEDKHEANKIAAVYGLPLNCKREELIEDRYVESLANIDLIVLLLNHADEIAELVKWSQKVTENVVDAEQMRLNALDLIMLKDALANLNKENQNVQR